MSIEPTTRGLGADEAARLLAECGTNEIPPAAQVGVTRQVFEQLRDPMLIVLMLAAVLTTLTGDHPDTIVIGLVIVLNTAVGIVQHRRAERAVAALRDLAPQRATVVRDGLPYVVPAAEVVPGDLLLLSGGDVVAADGLLGDAQALTLDESAMTGESLPVTHQRGETVTAGTLVVRGRGELVVTATGSDSGLGMLAAMVRDAPLRRTPLQDRMRRLSTLLVVTVLALTLLVVVLGLLRGEGFVEMLVVGASLAVAAVPESLPAVMTVTLATGAHRMARRSAVVRRLSAVETLGSVTVIATDKTGTLTHGSVAVEHVWARGAEAPGGDVRTHDLLRDLVLCNDAERTGGEEQGASGDPLEIALLDCAEEHGLDPAAVRGHWTRSAEVPFDAASQRMTTVHRGGPEVLTVVKGSPEEVLALVPDEDRAAALVIADAWAHEGCRVLAVTRAARADLTPSPGSMELAGLVAFSDPPREAAAGVVRRCREAGIRVVLVTGDHALTAHSVARKVGIEDETAHQPSDLPVDGDTDRFAGSVFARVRPGEKVELVKALQARGEVVAMLGDGVNDAPALKRSDIGVAAGLGGTEVARQAADVVLLDDDLSTVVAAIEEGRRIFANLRSFLVYAVSGGVSEVAVMLFGPFLGMALPLLPSQILWINLLTHGLTGVAFSAEPIAPGAMQEPPVPRAAPVLSRPNVVLLAVAAASLAVTALATGLLVGGDQARTATFVCLGLGQLGVALSLRSRPRRSGTRAPAAPGLPLAVAAAAILMLVPLVIGPLRELLGIVAPGTSGLAVAVGLAVVPALTVAVTRRIVAARPRSG